MTSFRSDRTDAARTRRDVRPAAAPPPPRPLRSLHELERRVEGCRSCGLHRGRDRPVTSRGPVTAALMVITDVPRRHEDLHGTPLAGSSANVLDNAFLDTGIDPSEVHVASVVRCRPQGDRRPSAQEIAACLPHLLAHVHLVRPRVIVALGAAVTSLLLGRRVSMGRVAGYRLDVLQGITLVPTYHPIDVVRGVPQAAASVRRDLAVAQAVLDGRLCTGAQALADVRSRLAADAVDDPAARSS